MRDGKAEFLLLHRAHRGPDYEGDWAWTPPAGARLPGEDPEDGARRELQEETGLTLPLQRSGPASDAWFIYFAEASVMAAIVLDAEHDRYAWLAAEEACARCQPQEVADQIRGIARRLDQRPPSPAGSRRSNDCLRPDDEAGLASRVSR